MSFYLFECILSLFIDSLKGSLISLHLCYLGFGVMSPLNSRISSKASISFQTNYRSHSDKLLMSCSDHLPVTSSFSILAFGRDLAAQRQVDDYAELVRFRFPGGRDDDDDLQAAVVR